MNKVVLSSLSSRPKRHKLWIHPLSPKNAHVKDWWWVALSDLLSTLSAVEFGGDRFPLVASSEAFFNRFGFLCGYRRKAEVLTWVAPSGVCLGECRRPLEEERNFTFIPEGFSDAVLEIAEQGIVRVGTELCQEPSRSPQHSGQKFNLVGYDQEHDPHPIRRGGRNFGFIVGNVIKD